MHTDNFGLGNGILRDVGRAGAVWPPGRALMRSKVRCSGLNAATDAPRNVADFCCGVCRRRLRAASCQLCLSLSECCSAYFPCCLMDAARPQQRVERPVNGTKINYGVRHDVRDRPRASFFHCRCSTFATAAICLRFLIFHAVRRSLTSSKELCVWMAL